VIGRIAKELFGLFVEDELLAVGIVIAIAAVAIVAWLAASPSWVVALLLVVAFPAVLTASVLRSVRRGGRT
jgi:hypothetical protein